MSTSIFLPLLGVLLYLIVRGNGMRKLADLKESGALSAEEFDRAKAKLLA